MTANTAERKLRKINLKKETVIIELKQMHNLKYACIIECLVVVDSQCYSRIYCMSSVHEYLNPYSCVPQTNPGIYETAVSIIWLDEIQDFREANKFYNNFG